MNFNIEEITPEYSQEALNDTRDLITSIEDFLNSFSTYKNAHHFLSDLELQSIRDTKAILKDFYKDYNRHATWAVGHSRR